MRCSTSSPLEHPAVWVEQLPVSVERMEGWEARLIDVVKAARHRPFEWGAHDCFQFACAAVHVVTGYELAWQWAGRYGSQREALACIAEYGDTFVDAFSKLFGVQPFAMAVARRGDIADFIFEGQHHLGVVAGTEVAMLAEQGLVMIPRAKCAHVWSIGSIG